jgi:hypothetical protein
MCHYLNFLCFQNQKFIGLISIIKIFAIKMMTRGTPWNVQPPFDTCSFQHQLYGDTWQSKPTYLKI